MRQDQVLVVGDPYFSMAELVGKVGDITHLRMGSIAGGNAGVFKRQAHGAIAGRLVRLDIALHPQVEIFLQRQTLCKGGVRGRVGSKLRGREEMADPVYLGLVQLQRGVPEMLPFHFDHFGEPVRAHGVEQYLDPGLVYVVTPSQLVVNPEDGFQVRQQVFFLQEFPDTDTQVRRAPQAAADQYPAAGLTCRILYQVDTDIMYLRRGAVVLRTGNRDLELARQEGKLRMEGGPLANNLTVRARVFQLIPGDTGEVIGGDVAYAVAAGLNRMHLHTGKIGQDIRHGFQFGPVELYVLAGTEMAVTLVIFLRDMRQHAQLSGRQQSIGNGHTQHGCMALDIQTVHQA